MRSIVSLSGGMDSATLLGWVREQGREIVAVSFIYGSKHNAYENEAALKLAVHYRIPFHLIDLSGVMSSFKSDLLKSGGDIPEGHYESATMSRTVVPGRNLIFASILAGLAWSMEAEEIYLGVHAGDHAIYPDCRPIFIHTLSMCVYHATDGRVQVKTPFLSDNKTSILKIGTGLDVPYHITRTCYKDQPVACGKCGSCQERLESFRNNNLDDPLEYESRVILPKG